MSDSPSVADAPARGKGWLRPTLRAIVFALVVAGLAWSVRSAYRGWKTQRGEMQQGVDALNLAADAAEDSRVARQLRQRADALEATIPGFANMRFERIVIASGLYALALLLTAIYWAWLLRRFDQPVPIDVAVRSHLFGHLGKYVPGKAMVVVLRVGGVCDPSNGNQQTNDATHANTVDPSVATVTVFLETLSMMGVGGFVAAVLLAFMDVPWVMRYLAVGLAAATCVATFPPLMRWVLRRVTKKAGPELLQKVNFQLLLITWLWMLIPWALVGLSFMAIVRSMPGVATMPELTTMPNGGEQGFFTLYCVCTATISLAYVAGFVSLVPGGAAVRELVLTTLLAPFIGPAPALLAAIITRFAYLIVELIIVLLCQLFRRR